MALRFRPYPGFTIATLIAAAMLIALGVWQVQRLHWKLRLIESISQHMHSKPVDMTETGMLPEEIYTQYSHVRIRGHFDNAKEVYLFTIGLEGEPVYHVLTPFHSDGGNIFLIDRGMVDIEHLDPSTRRAGQIEGETQITGFWRWPDALGYFTPHPDPAHRIWYGRDLSAIEKFDKLKLHQPGLVEADATPIPGGWPKGGQTVVDLPNNHLSYAITWFGLAAGLIGVYLAYHMSKGRLRWA
ncbi:MAG TPA: SURF1 family protein [Rhizomicrobium sp.]|nr:SURF1 family protein [Rhizomicrobium sp.]